MQYDHLFFVLILYLFLLSPFLYFLLWYQEPSKVLAAISLWLPPAHLVRRILLHLHLPLHHHHLPSSIPFKTQPALSISIPMRVPHLLLLLLHLLPIIFNLGPVHFEWLLSSSTKWAFSMDLFQFLSPQTRFILPGSDAIHFSCHGCLTLFLPLLLKVLFSLRMLLIFGMTSVNASLKVILFESLNCRRKSMLLNKALSL